MMIISPPCRLSPDISARLLDPVLPQTLDMFTGGPSSHPDLNSAIGQRRGKPADERDCLGTPSGELSRVMIVANRADRHCCRPRVPRVQHASQFVILANERIG